MSDTHIDVSIIVPVFNCAGYLEPLIASLRAQEGVALEIIAIDDGSTDGSLAVLEQLATEEPRLRVMSQPNAGLSCTRNVGIAQAQGRWVAFVDGDDWLSPDALKAWLELGELQSLQLVLGNGFRFETNPEQQARVGISAWRPTAPVLSGEEWVVNSVAQRAWQHYACLQFIRRDVLVKHGLRFVERIVHEDILWSAHLAAVVESVGVCQTPYYGYRMRPGSITTNQTQSALLKRARSYLIILRDLVALSQRSPPRLRRALLRQVNIESGH